MLSPRVLKQLRKVVGKESLLTDPADLLLYSRDSSVARGALPDAVLLPVSTAQVAEIVRVCCEHRIPFTPRGAGTNLSGGAVTPFGGLVISLARMDRILEIDLLNRCAAVEPGVVNLELQQALAPHKLQFCPDPASQKASTIGGNVAENAGGPHCLKYGVTSNHILGSEVVLPDGEVVQLGGKAPELCGSDLVGLFVGSEGTLGIVTKIIVRLSPLPGEVRTLSAIFDSLEAAGQATTEIIAAGVLPAAMEIMDKMMLWALREAGQALYPDGAEAVLIVELEGGDASLERRAAQCEKICRDNGAREVSAGGSAEERERLWTGRRAAYGAGAKISPKFLVNDGTVPRDKLAEVLRQVQEVGRRHRVRIGNFFHAGDGNLHPNIYFDADDPEERERAEAAAKEILEICVRAGGTVSGEHGIGLEKKSAMALVFSPAELAIMRKLKQFFDPLGICNPGKVLPDAVENALGEKSR
jgi:glycolate oxidase